SILLGKGDGSFSSGVDYLAGPAPSWVAVGDLNRDGFPDLAVSIVQGVTVLLNTADRGGGAMPPPRAVPPHPPHRSTAAEGVLALEAASQSQTRVPPIRSFTDVVAPFERAPLPSSSLQR